MDAMRLAIAITAVDATANVFDRIKNNFGRMEAQIQKLTDAGKHWQAMGAKLDKIGSMAGMGAGALGAFAAPAVAKIVAAQQGFALVQALTGKTASEMSAFRQQIYDIATQTGQGVDALMAQAMAKIRSGMEEKDVFKTLRQESLYATATGSKNIEAFAQTTKAMMRQMKLTVDEATDSYGGLLQISKQGGVALETFAQGSEALLGEAAALGMEGKKAIMQAYSAVQTAAKDTNPQTAMANVTAFLADLKKAKTENTFEKFGITIDHQAAFVSGDYYKSVVKQVLKATGELGKGPQEMILSQLFKSDASKSLIRSMASDMGDYKKKWQGATKITGNDQATKDAATATKTLAAQWEKFQNQLVKVGDSQIVPWLERITGALGWLAKDTFAAKVTTGGFLTLMAGAGAIKGAKFVGGAAKSIWDVGVAAKNAVQDIKGATKAAGSFGQGLSLWARFKFPNITGAFRAIRMGMAACMGPIGLIILGVAALVAIGVLVYKNWDKISAFFKKFWGWIKGAFSAAFDWVSGLFKKVPGWITWFFPIIKIPMLIIQNWDTIKAFFSGLWSWITGAFSGAWSWFTGFVTKIPEAFLSVIGRVKTAIQRIWATITGFFGKFKEAGKNIIQQIWDGIKSLVTKPIEAVKGMVTKIRNFLPFSPAKEGPLKDLHKIRIVETIADTIKPGNLASKMGSALKAATSIAMPAITALAPGARSAAAPIQIVINIDARGAAPSTELNIKKAIADAMPEIERRLAQSAERNARALNRP